MRKLLVTCALPYANGPIHLGHLVEYIQADIWCRFQRLRGHQVDLVCADDAHGTAIMLRAEQEDRSPEDLIADVQRSHQTDFADFLIEFSHYHSTHSTENRLLTEAVFQTLEKGGHIHKRTIEQAFDPKKGMFLPDRFIKGTCPKCAAEDQYGDNCERCGASYESHELINPRSVISGAAPELRQTEHLFFHLEPLRHTLIDWMEETSGTHQTPRISSEARSKLNEWLQDQLRDWDISRDAPYFGFAIPGHPNRYFYVWLDAPVGYMASHQALCEQRQTPEVFAQTWHKDSDVELYHFIGKDILYFHALFWPAMLAATDHRLPSALFTHGFLTINGQKMSKSRGTFINARDYLNLAQPEYLRYYLASRMGPSQTDIDFQIEDFTQRINSDLVGKYVNIASRCANFINKRFAGVLHTELHQPELFQQISMAADNIAIAYEQRRFGHAMRQIMALADQVNQYIDTYKPWLLAKDPEQQDLLHQVCSQALNHFWQLSIFLKPVLPALSAQVETLFQHAIQHWDEHATPLTGQSIKPFKPLIKRLQPDALSSLLTLPQTTTNMTTQTPDKSDAQQDNSISIDDFMKVELVIARIVEAEHIEGADKLLRLKVNLGHDDNRQIFAGIKSAYAPEDLINRLTIVVANLKPRKMRFGLSEGMVLAAGPGGKDLWILSPDNGAEPGMRVK